MFKYAYNSLVYYGEKVHESIARVARFGYDAIELYGEPDGYDPAEGCAAKAASRFPRYARSTPRSGTSPHRTGGCGGTPSTT
jgi:hypothetical protein